MKKRAYIIFVLTVIVCLGLIGCSSGVKDGSLEETKESTAIVASDYIEQYQAFLRGDISAANKTDESSFLKDLCLNYDAEKSNIKYALFDMTGDEVPELHILTEAAYNILTMNDEQLAIWYEADYNSRPLNNRAILEKVESTGAHYNYTILDNKGDVVFRCGFSEPAGGKLPFLFNCGEGDVELTEKEWDKLTKPFLSIGSDKIEWVSLVESATTSEPIAAAKATAEPKVDVNSKSTATAKPTDKPKPTSKPKLATTAKPLKLSKVGKNSYNHYFAVSDTTEKRYKGLFNGFMSEEMEKEEVVLRYTKVRDSQYGTLYKLRLTEVDAQGVWTDRLELGYFLVTPQKIYRVRSMYDYGLTKKEINRLCNKGEILPDETQYSIVCQEEALKDALGKNKKGWHELIEKKGDKRIFRSYNNKVETGFYERFVWKKNVGLVYYKSGYGAMRDHIELKT